MQTITSHPLEFADSQLVDLPKNGEILHAGIAHGRTLGIWVQADSGEPLEPVRVHLVASGDNVPAGANRHVGVFPQGQHLWHIFLE